MLVTMSSMLLVANKLFNTILCLVLLLLCINSLLLYIHFNNWYLQEVQITIQTLRQEISEVNDVHKRLYDFLIDSI